MKKSLIFNRLKFFALFYTAFFISLLFLASACGDADYSSSETEETGSIAFGIVWQDAPTMNDDSDSVVTRVLDCFTSGVATVEGEIYDEDDTYLTGGGPWNCDAHAGTIENVPAGSNNNLHISYYDATNGDLKYANW